MAGCEIAPERSRCSPKVMLNRCSASAKRLSLKHHRWPGPRFLAELSVVPEPVANFQIRASEASSSEHVHLPPDHFTCDECLNEMADSGDRRFRYPFINCTQCGPRYTLIERLPYDRANTSMARFPLCHQCAAEYANPGERRFHAEPLACPRCGPRLEFRIPGSNAQFGADALSATTDALRTGKIVAVKGIGGYHLLCDAANSRVVATLRARKNRPDKPLAVMFPLEPDLAALHCATVPDSCPRDYAARSGASDCAGAKAPYQRPRARNCTERGRYRRHASLQPTSPFAACGFWCPARRNFRQY